MNLIEEIETIVARESATQSSEPLESRIQDAIGRLPDMDTRERQGPYWFEYEVMFRDREEADAEAEILTWLRSLEIAAAPEVAAVIPFRRDDRVFVRRYWACPGERIRPVL